jgi:hypothetical protein
VSIRRLAALLLLTHGSLVLADPDGKIDTDGPDFVESSESVGKGRFQFETGPSFQRDKRDGADQRTVSIPLLLKLGMGGGIEARLETDALTWVSGQAPPDGTSGGTSVALHGFADTAIGLKWHSEDEDPARGIPSVAWLLHFELPSGTEDYRGRGVRPFLRSVISWDLPQHFTLGIMPGIEYDTRPDGTRFTSGIFGIVFGRWWTDRFRTFIEVSAPQIAPAQDGGVILYDDVGAACLLSDNWQLGGRVGWAANQNTPSEYILISLAGRF